MAFTIKILLDSLHLIKKLGGLFVLQVVSAVLAAQWKPFRLSVRNMHLIERDIIIVLILFQTEISLLCFKATLLCLPEHAVLKSHFYKLESTPFAFYVKNSIRRSTCFSAVLNKSHIQCFRGHFSS